MKSLLFVCLGNICRSPLAEGIAKKVVNDRDLDINVESAATGLWYIGEHPCPIITQVAANHGVDISNHVSAEIDRKSFDKYDLIVALDHTDLYDLSDLGAKKNLVKLGSFGLNGSDIADPHFLNKEDRLHKVEEIYNLIEKCVINLIDQKF